VNADNYKYAITVAGGRGPNVWDHDVTVEAPSLLKAVAQVQAQLEGDATIVAAEQID